MAPVVKRSPQESTPGQTVEVPEHNETESGSHRLTSYNHVTEAPPIIGNVIALLFSKICLY